MWLALELKVDAARAVAISDALLEQGAISVDVADAHAGTPAETPIYTEPGEDLELAFGENRVLALFEPDAAVAERLARACAAGALAASRFGAQPSLPTAAELDALLGSDTRR